MAESACVVRWWARLLRMLKERQFKNCVTCDKEVGGKLRLVFERDTARNAQQISEDERDKGRGECVNYSRETGLFRVTQFMNGPKGKQNKG